jgi:hypothetical protein
MAAVACVSLGLDLKIPDYVVQPLKLQYPAKPKSN